jgi:hypothetical protein
LVVSPCYVPLFLSAHEMGHGEIKAVHNLHELYHLWILEVEPLE